MLRPLLLALALLVANPGLSSAQLWRPDGEQFFSEIQDLAVIGSYSILVPNEGATGTTDTLVACYSSAGLAITCATTNTLEVLGPVVRNGGTTGSAVIGNSGIAGCQFDGATVAGHYVQLSTAVTGNCSDVGTSVPSNALRVLGTVTTTNGASGVYPVQMFSRGTVGVRGVIFASAPGAGSYLPKYSGTNTVNNSPVVDTGADIALESRGLRTNASSGGTGGTFVVNPAGQISYYNNTNPLDGQLLIGNTANSRFDKATLTAGAGISVTNAAGGITVAATTPGPTTVRLASNATANATTTGVEITGLKKTGTGTGTFVVRYAIRYQSSATGNGIAFGVNHTGTTPVFLFTSTIQTTGGGANAATMAQASPTNPGGMSTRAKSTTAPNMGPTTSVDAANTDMLWIIEGLLNVTADGDLELWSASEAAVSVQVMAESVLLLQPVP